MVNDNNNWVMSQKYTCEFFFRCICEHVDFNMSNLMFAQRQWDNESASGNNGEGLNQERCINVAVRAKHYPRCRCVCLLSLLNLII